MPQFTSLIACECGAEYERGEVRLPIKDIGVHECFYCGKTLEVWHGKLVPVFRLARAPKSKDVSVG